MNELKVFKQFIKSNSQKLTERTKNAVIYTRVSSKEQFDTNNSIEVQRKACEEYAVKYGYSIIERFGGTYESAKNDERKQFNKMLDFIKGTSKNQLLI